MPFSKLIRHIKGGKKKEERDRTLRKSLSNSEVKDKGFVDPPQNKSHTFTNGVSRPFPNNKTTSSKGSGSEVLSSEDSRRSGSLLLSSEDQHILESMQYTMSLPRHFCRRKALIEDDIKDGIGLSNLNMNPNTVTIRLEEGKKVEDIQLTIESHSLRDIIEKVLIKKNVFLKNDTFEDYAVTATFQGNTQNDVNLDLPSTQFTAHVVEIRPLLLSVCDELKAEETQTFKTVQDCLDFFSIHGLMELPIPHEEDEDTFRLPRVQPIDSIVGSWSDLPINPQVKEELSKSEHRQQLAIWEFIQTEHTHIRQLETTINVFMRCLELIRQAQLLTEESYHNVFGYMEDIYHAHDQFWTWTIEPVLEKVYETGLPLDLSEIIQRFPAFGSHFEIYQQHCQLETLNLQSLKKAKSNANFSAFLKWCEAQPECNRLELTQLLATPMQRLTRYCLLISAIIKNTAQPHIKQRLDNIWEEIDAFVQTVNNGIRIQEETERVRDAMNRITGFNAVDVPSELKDIVHPYTHLDLLAPMPDVEVDMSRMLMLEGTLKYRDNVITRMVPLHLFLFTDMLLITKLSNRKGGDKYIIVKEPYKIDRLVLHRLEPGLLCVVILNEFHVTKGWCILKANTSTVLDHWMEQISRAQLLYKEAVEHRAQNWKLLQNLQGERILNGIEAMESQSASLNQSLWSIHSLNGIAKGNSKSSTLLRTRLTSSSIDCLSNSIHIRRTKSVEQKVGGTFPRHHQAKMPHILNTSLILNQTNSTTQLEEGPESKLPIRPRSNLHTQHSAITFNGNSQEFEERHLLKLNRLHSSPDLIHIHKRRSAITFSDSLQELNLSSLQQMQTSPLSESDDSGTESGSTSIELASTVSPSLDCAGQANASKEIADAQYTVETPSAQEQEPTDLTSSSSTVTPPVDSPPSPPLRPILRLTKSSSVVESRNSLSLQLTMFRASSDDSGIAMKPTVSMGTELEQNTLVELKKGSLPSSLEQVGSEECNPQPKKQVRLHLQSKRDIISTPAHKTTLTTVEDKMTENVTTATQLTTSVDESIENATMEIRKIPNFSDTVPSSKHHDNRQHNHYIDRDALEVVSVTQLDNRSADGSLSVVSSSVDPGREKTATVEEESISHCFGEKIDQSEEMCSVATSLPVAINESDTVCIPLPGKEEPETQQEMAEVLVAEIENNCHDIEGSAPTMPASKSLRQDNKVQTLVQAFDSFSEERSDENSLILTSPKRSPHTPLKESKLPVPSKANSDPTPFTRQFAKRYRDNTSNKGKHLSVKNKPAAESRTAKRKISITSLKSVSDRPECKIPPSSTKNVKGRISLKIIPTDSQSRPVCKIPPSSTKDMKGRVSLKIFPTGGQSRLSRKTTSKVSCVGNGPSKTSSTNSKTPPQSSKHFPAVSSKTKECYIDKDALTQLNALAPKLHTTTKGNDRPSSICKGTKTLGGVYANERTALDRMSAASFSDSLAECTPSSYSMTIKT